MSFGCDDFRRTYSLSRRSLLCAGTAGFFGMNLARVLRAEANAKSLASANAKEGSTWSKPAGLKPRAKHVIFLHQFGGPSHIDTFDMKPDAPDGIRGEFNPIASSIPGVSICEHLPRWGAGLHHWAQLRSVHHEMKNHNSAGYYSLSGHPPPLDDIRLRDTKELFPGFGSIVANQAPLAMPGIPTYCSLPYTISDGTATPGQHASFLGKEFDPFFIGGDPNKPDFRSPELHLPDSLAGSRMASRRELMRIVDSQTKMAEWSDVARGLDTFQERALSMLTAPELKRAFELSQESDRLRDLYGRTTYGQSCLFARRLVEAGVRFVTVYFARGIGGKGSDGWDTHQDNFNDLKNRLLPISDQTVPTLISDLHDRGLLDETLVVWMGEFGRGPKIGDRDGKGRGHWPKCYTVMMAGGGIRGGSILGASDPHGAYPASDPVRPENIAATMYWALGIDPSAEVHDATDRPFPLANGRPLTELFG